MKVVTVLCHSGNHTEHKHLQLWSSRHLCVDRPKQPLTHLPRSRQRPLLWPESAAHSSADLELRSSHRHSLDGPRQPLNRQPRCKCTTCALNLLHIPELILHCRTVTTHVWMAQGDWLPPQHKANAQSDAATFACCATAVRCSPSCTPACKSMRLVRTCPSALMSFRKPFPKVF